VLLQPLARKDLDDAYFWAAAHAPSTATAWLRRFEAAIQTLEQHPQRCGLAWESRRFRRELREFNFGRKPNVFRVLFVVEAQAVLVVRIRRAAQRRLRREDLSE
jgi:plasmid stabilization system protein ParE